MIKIPIVGMRHIDKDWITNFNLHTGNKISLFKEEFNKYDKKAIYACYVDEEGKYIKFGYVAKDSNDGTIDTNIIYKITTLSYKCIYIEKYDKEKEEEEEYDQLEADMNCEYAGSMIHDKPDLGFLNFFHEDEENEF